MTPPMTCPECDGRDWTRGVDVDGTEIEEQCGTCHGVGTIGPEEWADWCADEFLAARADR